MERLLLTRAVCFFFTVVSKLMNLRAVVMVIDSQDRERLPVARKELHSICSESSELAKDALLLVLVLLCSAGVQLMRKVTNSMANKQVRPSETCEIVEL